MEEELNLDNRANWVLILSPWLLCFNINFMTGSSKFYATLKHTLDLRYFNVKINFIVIINCKMYASNGEIS